MRIKKCIFCHGTGVRKLPPHYSNPMPEDIEIKCDACNGKGEVIIVPNGYVVVREGNEYTLNY